MRLGKVLNDLTVSFAFWSCRLVPSLLGDPAVPSMDVAVYVIVISATALKALLFILCNMLRSVSDTTLVLAEDHRNDVLSNTVVIIAASVATTADNKSVRRGYLYAFQMLRYWYVDPIGGTVISFFILGCWMALADKQIKKIVGLQAPDQFRDKIHDIASSHDGRMEVDVIRAYHLGLRFFVEVDVVMPGTVPLFDSHDSALDLQCKVGHRTQTIIPLLEVDPFQSAFISAIAQ